ncbi:MAG TPA: HD domain-containing protein, partial [Candidatus Korarchaeota archaeon]|nr:HD domain-containing protein [Candidatus Korarchaeota archaeon]
MQQTVEIKLTRRLISYIPKLLIPPQVLVVRLFKSAFEMLSNVTRQFFDPQRGGKLGLKRELKEALELLTRLEESWSVRRLTEIDLSVVPPWLVEELAVASRYEHSTHVAHLALIASLRLDLDPLLLSVSGLLHDVGCGPFPHISDELMRIFMGWEHPSNVKFVLEKSSDRELSQLEEFGLDPSEVFDVISGVHEYSPLINGEIDVDNADNIYRYIATMPSLPLGEPLYRPLEIVLAMRFEGRKLEIEQEVKRRWAEDRDRIYSYLENHEGNIAAWVMLSRAMRLLMQELDENFFLLTNKSAFSLFISRLPELSRNLLDRKFLLLENLEMPELNEDIRSLVTKDRAD